ncbi:MAG: DUF2796 domain-containing protein [Alcaligenaceae bacterium]|nr:DUF2796 domain-containing protein [Alcaligenaceae bacterium]
MVGRHVSNKAIRLKKAVFYALTLVVALPGLTSVAHASKAHAHGQAELNIAIDAETITLNLVSPLDNLTGFEHAPRTPEQHTRARQAAEHLQNADQLFIPDPGAGCTLDSVDLESAILVSSSTQADKTAAGTPAAPVKDTGQHAHTPGYGTNETHADVELTATFQCENTSVARFINTTLFDTFKRLQTMSVQIASPNGQGGLTLKRGTQRIALPG